MTKERMHFNPQWQGPIEEWSKAYAKANAWRTAPDMDDEDLVQEGFFLFVRIRDLYRLDGPGHLFSMYRRAFTNKINTFSSKRTRRHKLVQAVSVYDEDLDAVVNQVESAEASAAQSGMDRLELALALIDPPPEIEAVLRNIAGEVLFPRQRLMRQRRQRGPQGERETTNQYLARAAGLDPSQVNMVQAVLNWIQGEPTGLAR